MGEDQGNPLIWAGRRKRRDVSSERFSNPDIGLCRLRGLAHSGRVSASRSGGRESLMSRGGGRRPARAHRRFHQPGRAAGRGRGALGWRWADPVFGLVITVTILGVLRSSLSQVGGRLMDAVDPALIDRATEALSTIDGVEEVRELRLRWIGTGCGPSLTSPPTLACPSPRPTSWRTTLRTSCWPMSPA